MKGHVEITYSDGGKYKGEYANGKRNGLGALEQPDKCKYEGYFENDLYQGKGRL